MKSFIILVTLSFLLVSNQHVSADSDIEIVKRRVVQTLIQETINDQSVGQLLTTFQDDNRWPGINYDDISRTGFEHRIHLANMLLLARAYQNKESKYFQSKKVKQTINLALTDWVNHDYICDNWWHNQIGTTNALVTLMLIIGDDLQKELVKKAQPIIGRANVNAPGARPGGDRIKIAGIQAKNLLFNGDGEKFDDVIQVIENEIKYTEWVGAEYGYGYRLIKGGFGNREAGGRGIQYDNSFHHRTDGVNNTLSYGMSYADAFVEWAVYTRGTKYSFSEKKLSQLVDYFLDGICKMSVYGKYPDPGAKNRSISREGSLHAYRPKTAEKLLMVTDYRQDDLQEIVDVRKNGIKPTLSHATYFWHSDHFSFQRPNFFTSVRMYSTRVHNMEWPYNSEGLLNHHRGDGVNHISVTGDEYYDIWPVYDYQKIPGTTVMQKPELPSENEIQKLGETDFVGAVTDGKYGTVAFDFKSPHDPLIARKSWFFFDDEFVCLGAGISCHNDDHPVVTTLNQCLLRGDVSISINDSTEVLDKGERKLNGVQWVYEGGVGYVFPKPTALNIKNDKSYGSWWRINKQSDSPKGKVEIDVFNLWIDHGKRPSNESYEYIIVPATTIDKLEDSKSNIDILANTPQIQAVRNKALGMYQVIFYKAGEIMLLNDIKLVADNPGIVMIKMKDNQVSSISVADPNRELNLFHLKVKNSVDGNGDNFRSRWNDELKMTELSIDLPQGDYAGSSVTIDLN